MHSLMNIPLLQEIRAVLNQEFLDRLLVRVRFPNDHPADWKVVGLFRPELSANKADPYASVLKHQDVNVRQNLRAWEGSAC